MKRRPGLLSVAGLSVAFAVLALSGAGCGSGGAEGGAGDGASPSPSPTAGASTSAAASSPPAADVVQAAQVRHVTVGDLAIGYRVIGPFAGPAAGPSPAATAETAAPAEAKTPLLLIMGSSGTMDLWPPAFVTPLAQGREVIVFDNRGMGATDDPGGAYPFSQLADDTAGLIKALGYDTMDVLGWSMGGDVAIDLAVRHPEVVGSLVSYAGAAGGRKAIPPTKEALSVLTDTSGTPQERGMRLLELLFPAAYRSAHPDYAATFPIPKEQMSPQAIALQNQAIGEWAGVWDGLKDISCPALFATGTEDVIAPAGNAAMLAAVVPGSWLVRFPGAGHGLMYQDPEGLAAVVVTFLDQGD